MACVILLALYGLVINTYDEYFKFEIINIYGVVQKVCSYNSSCVEVHNLPKLTLQDFEKQLMINVQRG